jgi:hypothetical protein
MLQIDLKKGNNPIHALTDSILVQGLDLVN